MPLLTATTASKPMGDIAFWTLVALGASAFCVTLAAYDLNAPLDHACHHCGQNWDELCDTATEAVGEACCHACGKQILDVDTATPVCHHPDTATWRRKPRP